jgi:hypothetical protein
MTGTLHRAVRRGASVRRHEDRLDADPGLPTPTPSCERWVGTLRAECLDWALVLGHGGLDLRTLVEEPSQAVGDSRTATVRRQDVLGGLIHEYTIALSSFTQWDAEKHPSGADLGTVGHPKGQQQVASDTSMRSFARRERTNLPESTVLSLVRGDRAET